MRSAGRLIHLRVTYTLPYGVKLAAILGGSSVIWALVMRGVAFLAVGR